MVIAAGAMTALSYLAVTRSLRSYLELSRTPGASGADHILRRDDRGVAGVLWYNAHPAEIFMGDVGSLALGGGWRSWRCCSNRKFCCYSSAEYM